MEEGTENRSYTELEMEKPLFVEEDKTAPRVWFILGFASCGFIWGIVEIFY